MVTFTEDDYDSKSFKSFKRYKQYKQKIEEEKENRPPNAFIEQKYFNCLYCGKVNLVEDIVKEKSENRTMRAKYLTWKKLKDISNEMGGSFENGLNYLLSLHEDRIIHGSSSGNANDVPIAGFGGGEGDEEKKK